jgi:hypothetical protein
MPKMVIILYEIREDGQPLILLSGNGVEAYQVFPLERVCVAGD